MPETIVYRPIGIIHSPHRQTTGMPIQPTGAIGVAGEVEVFYEFAAGLADLAGFSHLHLLYHFHAAPAMRLSVVPFLDDRPRGLFATRAPARPNPLGMSVVALREVRGNVLRVVNLDVLDGTPLIDIKPYVPAFDSWEVGSVGWLAGREGRDRHSRADSRFGEDS